MSGLIVLAFLAGIVIGVLVTISVQTGYFGMKIVPLCENKLPRKLSPKEIAELPVDVYIEARKQGLL